MASRSTAAAKPALLPPGVVAFFRRRLIEVIGLALLAGAAFLALALISFDPADPSLNTAARRVPVNLAGAPGAYAADLLLQLVGAAAVVLVAALAAWGWRLVSHRPLIRLWLRFVSLFVALVVAASAAAAVPVPSGWPLPSGLGGVVGAGVFGALAPLLARADIGEAVFAAAGIAAGLAALAPALGLAGGEWRALGHRMLWIAVLPVRGAYAAVSHFDRGEASRDTETGQDTHHGGKPRIEPRLRGRPRAAIDNGAARGPATRGARPKSTLRAAKIVAPRADRRAAHQEMLDLCRPASTSCRRSNS